MAFGFFVVLLGWVLNVPLVIGIYFFMAKPLYKKIKTLDRLKTNEKYSLLTISGVVWFLVLMASYLPGWLNFKQQCTAHKEPVLSSINGVNFYYIDHVNPNGPFLELNRLKQQFKNKTIAFIEGPNIFKTRHKPNELPFRRYFLNDKGGFDSIKVNSIESTYGYRESHHETGWITSHSKEVYRIKDNQVLSKYVTFDYMGGPLGWLVQPFGYKHCPDYDDRWFKLSYSKLDIETFDFGAQ